MELETRSGDVQGGDGKDEEMNFLLGVQCRSASARFPGKYKANLGGVPILKRIYDTCCSVNVFPKVNHFDTVVLVPEGDDEIEAFCDKSEMLVYHGHKDDLVDRYWNAAHSITGNYDAVVRITGDCPLIPKHIIEDVVRGLMEYDYVTNVNPRTYPDGYDCQGISAKGLEWINKFQSTDREHPFLPLDTDPRFFQRFMHDRLTVRMIINPSRTILNPYHLINKLSVDTPQDLVRIERMIKNEKAR